MRYNQEEQAIIKKGFDAGGFPLSKRKLISIFNNSAGKDFDALKEEMRKALMLIESESMTMEQISSAAHICAVVGYKLSKGAK